MNKITKLAAGELDTTLVAQWRELQQQSPELANPYFCVEYFQAVAAVRDDVHVAVIENGDSVIGFFPYQSAGGKVAEPVGGRLSDYQGVIGRPGEQWHYDEILDACGVKIWDFDHLLASQAPDVIHRRIDDVSPTMDLRDGFEAYLAQRKKAGAKRLDQFRRKTRKFEREVGKLEIDLYSRDEAAFCQVIEWKNAQCRRTGVPEFLNWGWTEGMLREIWQHDSDVFAGMLTVVRVDDDIVAAHFGMRSNSVCHWWFPTYNQQYGKYSPGGILLLKLAEAVAAEGIASIDLGKGDDAYKPSFANGEVALVEGSVLRPSLQGTVRKSVTAARGFLKESPLTRPLRSAYRGVKGLVRPQLRQA